MTMLSSHQPALPVTFSVHGSPPVVSMKRSLELSPNQQPKKSRSLPTLSLQDILHALDQVSLNADDLQLIYKKLDSLYAVQVNQITQTFPPDLWNCIFQAAALPQLPLASLLSFRTVSQRWNKTISSFPQINSQGAKLIPELLRVFPSLRYLRLEATSEFDYSLLTGLTHLRLEGVKPRLSADLCELAPLTNLTKLTISNNTNITALGPLTSLGCLSLKGAFDIDRHQIEPRTHITRLISTRDDEVFWTGQGILKDTEYRYEGGFVEGLFDGYGVVTLRDGFQGDGFIGNFHKGKKHGQGKYLCKSGAYFDGLWNMNEKVHGAQFDGNSTYTGPFIGGACTGRGTILYVNGDYYEGDVVQGEGHGQGVMTLACGEKLIGEFKRGKFKRPTAQL